MMKRLISLILFLMMVFLVVGCYASLTPEERKAKYDLSTDYGNKPFIGNAGRSDLEWIGRPSPY
jgi:hypothetical protein